MGGRSERKGLVRGGGAIKAGKKQQEKPSLGRRRNRKRGGNQPKTIGIEEEKNWQRSFGANRRKKKLTCGPGKGGSGRGKEENEEEAPKEDGFRELPQGH